MGPYFNDCMDHNFLWSYEIEGAHFWDFGCKKSQVRRNLKRGRFAVKKLLLCLR